MNYRASQAQVCSAIEIELGQTSQHHEFVITGRKSEGDLWTLFVDLDRRAKTGLDERFEASSAWWAGPPEGSADVLSVVPETQQINLRYASTPPPQPGKKIRFYPPRYLPPLLASWKLEDRATASLAWLQEITTLNTFDRTCTVSPQAFLPWLRQRQAMAFELPGWHASFLWGPPGTGKTITLGAILAQHLVQFSSSRILLLSTSNAAVDVALIAVDKCLEELCHRSPVASRARHHCFRVGNHFIATNYDKRQHLLPIRDKSSIADLAQLESERPDPQNVRGYAAWKHRVESVRNTIRVATASVVERARLAALTTTHAVFVLEDLLERAPFDFIVFDEASQISLAYALMIAPLGTRTLFAGDPSQLSPIVSSDDACAQRWLGRSPFALMKEDAPSTVLLNQQSRMVEPICRVVSRVFYKNRLAMADDSERKSDWRRHRQLVHIGRMGQANVYLHQIHNEGTWLTAHHGPIRHESAHSVAELVREITVVHEARDLLVLTPFRSQCALIRRLLRQADCARVTVSTVHRAQGGERHTVIFDPVDGQNPFLTTDEAHRLINVALSRAQARLILLLSRGDRANPILDQIAQLIENESASSSP